MPSIRLADLAQQLDAELHGDGDIVITGVASMQSAKTGQITFMVNPKYREHLAACQASAVVMTQDDLPFAHSAALVVRNSYLTYARMAQIPGYHAAASALGYRAERGYRSDGEAEPATLPSAPTPLSSPG